MSCDHELANEWARCGGKNASYITMLDIYLTKKRSVKHPPILINTAKANFLYVSMDNRFYRKLTFLLLRYKSRDHREIKIEVCINTANGKPRLEVRGHAFEVCCT